MWEGKRGTFYLSPLKHHVYLVHLHQRERSWMVLRHTHTWTYTHTYTRNTWSTVEGDLPKRKRERERERERGVKELEVAAASFMHRKHCAGLLCTFYLFLVQCILSSLLLLSLFCCHTKACAHFATFAGECKHTHTHRRHEERARSREWPT